MSFPSGSTILVLLQSGSAPSVGPFDLYINSVSPSNLVTTSSISKTDLSSSGYTFNTPAETYNVWAKSTGSITTSNVAILGNISGSNWSINIRGAYNASLNPSLITSNVFYNNGRGLQTGGHIGSNLNTCPSVTIIGTASINDKNNTLIVVKEHETGSNYIKFYANGSSTSNYFYYIPSNTYTGITSSVLNVCVDLAGGYYQTASVGSINVHPTANLSPSLTKSNTLGSPSEVNGWIIVKSNGATVYSSSITGSGTFSAPGNTLVEVTSSLLQPISWTTGSVPTTSSLNVQWTYGNEYSSYSIYSKTQNQILVNSTDKNVIQYSFYAVPGSSYSFGVTDIISYI